MEENSITIYIDGSYHELWMIYGSAFVALLPDDEIGVYKHAGNEPHLSGLKNIAGEMIAAMSAVSYAVRHGYEEVKLYFDYKGIEYWPKRIWRTKNEFTRKYAEFMRKKEKEINIQYKKVPSHSNIEYNEIADRFAKQAVHDFRFK